MKADVSRSLFCGNFSQAPQSADRQDQGEERCDAERDERPHKKQSSAGVDHPAADKSCPSHVSERHDRSKQRSEQDDDVPGSPPGEHQRSVQPDDKHDHPTDVSEPSWLEPADDVVRQMKRSQKDRQQGRDG